MRNKNVLAYLGLWEKLNNSNFKGYEFDTFESETGKNSFYIYPQKWIKETMLNNKYYMENKEDIIMKNNKISNSELIIYESTDGKIKLDVNLENETVWLSLEQMSRLFGRDKSVISRHIKNIFEEGELEKDATIANFATVQT